MKRFGLAGAIAMVAMWMVPGIGEAAEPSQGTVDAERVKTEWVGTVEGAQTAVIDVVQGEAGGTHGTCVEPSCDTYALTVSANPDGQPLVIDAAAVAGSNNLMLEVVLPDGGVSFDGGTLTEVSTARRMTIPSAPAGTYEVRIGGEARQATNFVMDYEASATLGDPGQAGCRALKSFAYDSGGEPLSGAVTNDPLYGKAFGHPQMKVPAAWERGARGRGAVIAVVDTGGAPNQPDLRENLVGGIDLVEGIEGDCAPGPFDNHGHGTMVAGFAAASAGNGIGVAGVAPEAKIMPIRVCSSSSCDNGAIAAGIRWAADHGADVINLSLGEDESMQIKNTTVPGTDLDRFVDDVAYAVERGAVVISVAQNNSWALCAHPAADPGAVCVAAVDKRGLPTTYSNLPADDDGEEIVAFRAFGGGTVSTPDTTCDEFAISTAWPGGKVGMCGEAYQGGAGTSFASPHVAGAAAILSTYGLTNLEIIERLKATASNGGEYDPVMGYGIPDLAAATEGLTLPSETEPDKPKPGKPHPEPGDHGQGSQHGQPGDHGQAAVPQRRDSSRCRQARAAVRRAIKAAVRARDTGRRRALKKHLRTRNRAQGQVRRHCR